MWYVYILFCDKKIFYVGLTDDVERRLKQHKNKESFYTKKFSRIELVHKEEFDTRKSAEQREKQLKGWSVAKKKALIAQDYVLLQKIK
jgi:predicted GIY-YIG superfamily endonuclease